MNRNLSACGGCLGMGRTGDSLNDVCRGCEGSGLAKVRNLIHQEKNALANAGRQRRKIERFEEVTVRPSFWEQVARDYRRKIDRLKKTDGRKHRGFYIVGGKFWPVTSASKGARR